MLAPARPGYVYVLANPSLQGWRKVGHTHRPPHRRADELSRTALPTAFEVEYARFFWDALAAEQQVHREITRAFGWNTRRKEFFNLPLEQAREIILRLPDAGKMPPGGKVVVAEDEWEDSLEGRETLWEWAEDDWKSPDPERRRKGWRELERLSAAGWGEGSWRLSELLLHASPSIEGAHRAAWVLDAAHAQGVPEAALRAAWLRSWDGSADSFEGWRQEVEKLPRVFGNDWRYWPLRVKETLEAERRLWVSKPERLLSLPWLESSPTD